MWSSDSKKLAYVAEVKNKATSKCLLTSKYEKTKSSGDQDKPEAVKDEDLVTEDNYQEVSISCPLTRNTTSSKPVELESFVFARNMPTLIWTLGESSWLERVNQ